MVVPKSIVTVRLNGEVVATHTLEPGEYEIGRAPECAIFVGDEELSRRHARLTLNYDHALIEDLGSRNGTFVNGKRLESPQRLWPNQVVSLGPAVTVSVKRLKGDSTDGASLAPVQAAGQRLLPEKLRRDRRYEIGGVLAEGGMGAILKATETATDRLVAMKVMLEQAQEDDVTRFIAEAKITGQLEHPNIVPVHELGVDEFGQIFYTMKLIRGVTLKKVLELIAAGEPETVQKYPLASLLTIFQKVCDAVAFAHSKKVIHRDLKPENLMLGDFGEMQLMDWGLAKVLTAELPPPGPTVAPIRSLIRAGPGQALAGGTTLAGMILGTPQYMAPEQANGETEALDERSDVYALGAILYEILTLRPPVEGANVDEVLENVRHGHIAPPVEAYRPPKQRGLSHLPGGRVPEALAAVAMKALAGNPEYRYSSVPALQQEIEAFQNGFATQAERAGLRRQVYLYIRRHRAVAVAVGLLLLVFLAVLSNVLISRQQVYLSLQRLRGTAPTFEDRALALIDSASARPEALPEALDTIGHAIALVPESAEYRVVQGRILQSMLRLGEAREAFEAALKLAPDNALARQNAELCRRLQAKGGDLSAEDLAALQNELQRQGRTAESLLLLRQSKNTEHVRATWEAVLAKAGISRHPGIAANGLLQLDFSSLPIDNLNVLHGMPLGDLSIANSPFSDLSPLAGMPLRRLILAATHVTDLSPLRGMPLEELNLSATGVTDLSPLRGMPLKVLAINSTVQDLSVLRSLPLESLDGGGNPRLSDLTVLAGLKLMKLNCHNTKVVDLRPLQGMPLEELILAESPRLRDLSPLAGLPLRRLVVNECQRIGDLTPLRHTRLLDLEARRTAVTDVRPLADTPLQRLDLSFTAFTEVSQLAALRGLEDLVLNETPVTDLEPLRGSGLKRLTLYECTGIVSLAPLAGLKQLQALELPVQAWELADLAKLPALKWIGYHTPPGLPGFPAEKANVADFWQRNAEEAKARAADPNGRLRPKKFNLAVRRFPGAKEFHGHWYFFYWREVSWPVAERVAYEMGGHLVTIGSKEEDEFLGKTYGSGAIPGGTSLWIGAQVGAPGGLWEWITDEPWKYTHWGQRASGNNSPASAGDKSYPPKLYATFSTQSELTNRPAWVDFPEQSSGVIGFLVEWDDDAIPRVPVQSAPSAPAAPSAASAPPEKSDEQQAEDALDASDAATLAAANTQAEALARQFQFKAAVAQIKAAEAIGDNGKRRKATALKRMERLEQFLATLEQDIGTRAFTGTLPRKAGLPVTGSVVDADDLNLIVKTQAGSVKVPWTGLAFESLYNLALSYLRTDLPPDRLADRLWCLATYCDLAGEPARAKPLFEQALERKPELAAEQQ